MLNCSRNRYAIHHSRFIRFEKAMSHLFFIEVTWILEPIVAAKGTVEDIFGGLWQKYAMQRNAYRLPDKISPGKGAGSCRCIYGSLTSAQ
jgi:hypothetical protein